MTLSGRLDLSKLIHLSLCSTELDFFPFYRSVIHSYSTDKQTFCQSMHSFVHISSLAHYQPHGEMNLPGTHRLLNPPLPTGIPQPFLLRSTESQLWPSWFHHSRHWHWRGQQGNLIKHKNRVRNWVYNVCLTFYISLEEWRKALRIPNNFINY